MDKAAAICSTVGDHKKYPACKELIYFTWLHPIIKYYSVKHAFISAYWFALND